MLKDILPAARGDKKADLVFKNARIMDVFQEEIHRCDLAVAGGVILGWGNYSGQEELDLAGDYLAPAFIDPHLHIESSQISVQNFARQIIPGGVLTVIADPHEIANVAGAAGIKYMLERGRRLPWNFRLMLPSCVPATPWEESGAELKAEDLAELREEPGIFGLGEVMDYPGVIKGDEDIWAKLELFRGGFIDGHAPEVSGCELNSYLLAGIAADHECTTASEARDKASRGMYIMIREGSVTKNLEDLLSAVDDGNVSRFMFATDDRQPEDLVERGHLDYAVKKAIDAGLEPLRAYRMASLNPAEALGLEDLGAIAPGRRADLMVLDDLEQVSPLSVYKDGIKIAGEGEICENNWQKFFFGKNSGDDREEFFDAEDLEAEQRRKKVIFNSINLPDIESKKFGLPEGESYRIIELQEEQVLTGNGVIKREPGESVSSLLSRNQAARLAAVERHNASGKSALGLVRGFGLEQGALATSVSHDSHNIMVLGREVEDMKAAVEELKSLQGGIVVVNGEEVISSFPLPIAGLMSSMSAAEAAEQLGELRTCAAELGVKISDPFMQLSFLSLPVIPELKLTVNGLFDVNSFQHVSLLLD